MGAASLAIRVIWGRAGWEGFLGSISQVVKTGSGITDDAPSKA